MQNPVIGRSQAAVNGCVVYGVLADVEGRPIALEVYPGNTGDPSTVPAQIEKLRHRFGLEQVVLVGDRGMLTQTQIAHLKMFPVAGTPAS